MQNALLFGRQRCRALKILWCSHTDPEIAHVDLSVKEAREHGIPVNTYTVPMHEVDRAIADGEEDGFVKIEVRDDADTILGATVGARHAGKMINGLSLAMVAGIGLKTVALVIHAYPTQADTIKKAVSSWASSRPPPFLSCLQRYWINL